MAKKFLFSSSGYPVRISKDRPVRLNKHRSSSSCSSSSSSSSSSNSSNISSREWRMILYSWEGDHSKALDGEVTNWNGIR